ncbi:MAG: cobyric acid synthase [Fervidobacterium sp.]|uniref:cobyric acid synthase n=1 Tax=Fervidobacterium sp. TaxID=1871331 RepID=UPI0040491592
MKKGSLMIQGTSSAVGKSVIALALCRYFSNKGYKVAPFKSQNLSTVSFTSDSGQTFAWAQALQAFGAKTEPIAEMNPILVKPVGGGYSEVFVLGRGLGRLHYTEYNKKKALLWKKIREAYNILLEKYDIVIVEGAGSPVELNLKKGDIVNMKVARSFGIPVLIVGNIHLGGVFASLFGTYKLLSRAEQKLVKGFIVNKLKGSKEHLGDGLKTLERLTKVRTVGVVPFIEHHLEDEDNAGKSAKSIEKNMDSSFFTNELDSEIERISNIVCDNLDMVYIEELLFKGDRIWN